MYKGNNSSIVKQAVRGLQPQSEFCALCRNTVVDTRGGVCFDCAVKAEKLAQCRKKRGIVTRIIQGRASCVLPGGAVTHQGKGCAGCRFEST